MIVSYFIINKINQNLGKIVLIIGSAVFYIYGGWNIAAILGASIVVNYTLAFLIDKLKKIKKPLIFIDIIANVALLFYFKYYNFTMLNICKMLDKSFTMKEIILPLGISFFTFQQIMYVVNVYRGTLENKGLIDYLVYILYFPKIIMGPIVEPAELIAQINDEKLKKVDWDNIASGLKLFSFGLFKKLILADTFAKAVNWGFGNVNNATAMDLFLVMLFYTFEIYFDFSGYTDMAVGVSGILNIKLPMNFD
jgi:alginate O-acetyltransferase complex protein AlgI